MSPDKKLTPMIDALEAIDKMMEQQMNELIELAQKLRKEVIKAYIDRGIYE